MGVFIWHDWARLLALTSACFTIWAAAWGIFFRKYFWSFVGGELGAEGLIPPPQAAFFVKTIVTLPLFQSLILVSPTRSPKSPHAEEAGAERSADLRNSLTLPPPGLEAQTNGLLTLALEYPLPQLRGTTLHGSLALRVGFYLFAALPSMFVYQTVDGGVFYLVTSLAYLRALRAGESLGSEVEERQKATAVA
ncbi:hypothetical protein JCM1841_000102 [Sporobolomyces salmonicolor]